ncbi:MAG: hypothetical protein WC610_04600, partial [Patescibacteria group bacterium]
SDINNNPFTLYHHYDYWGIKGKNRVFDYGQQGDDGIYCEGEKVNLDNNPLTLETIPSGQCYIKAKITITDNWYKVNNKDVDGTMANWIIVKNE